MSRFKRLQVLNTFVGTGIVPLFYNKDAELVKNVVKQTTVPQTVKIDEMKVMRDKSVGVGGCLLNIYELETRWNVVSVQKSLIPKSEYSKTYFVHCEYSVC